MSTPEKCPKCGVREVYTSHNLKGYACGTLVSASGRLFHTATCQTFVELRKPLDSERDQLAERVRELEAWKESAMSMEREWDPNQLAKILGGQLGESQRAVIQWKVPILVQRVKRLEVAGDAMAMAEGCRCDDGVICRRCADRVKAWHAAKGQP